MHERLDAAGSARPRRPAGRSGRCCGEVLGRITGDLSTWTAEVRRGPPGEPRRGPGGEDGRPRSAGPYVRGASRPGAGGGTPGCPAVVPELSLPEGVSVSRDRIEVRFGSAKVGRLSMGWPKRS